MRWFKRAVLKSFNQIRGAERWISQFPNRIFLDRKCTNQLPLKIPPSEQRRVHGIIVARGAGRACKEFFQGGSGSLMIMPDLKRRDHIDPRALNYSPFTIGDIDPSGPFVHVLDDSTLTIMLGELDTVTDFTSYLQKKEAFIRSGNLHAAFGEENLLAHYLKRTNELGEHDFVKNDGEAWKKKDRAVFEAGIYEEFVLDPKYKTKKIADEDSYVWDSLIEAFTNNMLAGTTIVHDGAEFNIAELEKAIRHMALVPRYQRRSYGRGIIDALKKSHQHDRFVRAFIPVPEDTDQGTGFFFMTFKIPDVELDGGYDQYREIRRRMLYWYALALLEKNRHIERIIGIATEPRAKTGKPTGSSEDLMLVEMPEWTEAMLGELAENKAALDIMREGRFNEYAISENEYPNVESIFLIENGKDQTKQNPRGLNREQRRAKAAKERKNKSRKNSP